MQKVIVCLLKYDFLGYGVLYYWEMDNKVLQYFTFIKNKTMQTTTTDSKLLNFLLIFLHYLPENNT